MYVSIHIHIPPVKLTLTLFSPCKTLPKTGEINLHRGWTMDYTPAGDDEGTWTIHLNEVHVVCPGPVITNVSFLLFVVYFVIHHITLSISTAFPLLCPSATFPKNTRNGRQKTLSL